MMLYHVISLNGDISPSDEHPVDETQGPIGPIGPRDSHIRITDHTKQFPAWLQELQELSLELLEAEEIWSQAPLKHLFPGGENDAI